MNHEKEVWVSYDFIQNYKTNDTSIEGFEENLYLNLFSSTSNEDLGSQENDIHFLNLYYDLDRFYWEFLGDPIYDASRKGSVDF
jgi:hypothetical protein